MIRYRLICDAGHDFESWFANSTGFEEQARRGFVSCPACGSTQVERAIMAPAVARTDRSPRIIEAQVQSADASMPAERPVTAHQPLERVALMGEKEIALRQLLAAVHKHVVETAEDVGKRFADEALKIHHGETESRPIYGQASADDAAMLVEEGVEFMPLPRLPDAQN